MSLSFWASIVSVIAVIITGVGTILTSVNAKRTTAERNAERMRLEADREVQLAQRDKLKEEASEIAMRKMSTELGRVRDELEKAYSDLEAARKIRRELEARIDDQDIVIRRQNRRLKTLEEWADTNEQRFSELGIDGLPKDLDHDRDRDLHDPPPRGPLRDQ